MCYYILKYLNESRKARSAMSLAKKSIVLIQQQLYSTATPNNPPVTYKVDKLVNTTEPAVGSVLDKRAVQDLMRERNTTVTIKGPT